MKMQVWDGLTDHVINEDHRPVRFKSSFNGALKALYFDKELLYSVGGQLTHELNVNLGNKQNVTVEQWAMVQE